jgi:hypothetical protein
MKDPTKRAVAHALQPTILSVVVLGVGGAFAVAFPWDLVVFYLSILPFPLFLLWAGRDAPSAQQVIAAADRARAQAGPLRS